MWQTPLYLFLNISLWGIKPLWEKGIIRETNSLDMSCLRYIVGGILCAIILLVLNRTKNFTIYPKRLYLKMISIAFIGFIALYANYWLLSKHEANFVMALAYPSAIVTTAILGHYFYKEVIPFKRWLGIFIICVGLFIVYSTK